MAYPFEYHFDSLFNEYGQVAKYWVWGGRKSSAPLPVYFQTLGEVQEAIAEFTKIDEEKEMTRVEAMLQQYQPIVASVEYKRRLSQPPFKLDFDTLEDIRMRLNGSVILIGGKMYCVREVHKVRRDWALVVSDEKARFFYVMYSSPLVDLRAPEPRYVLIQDLGVVWLFRPPSQQQSQGGTEKNMCYFRVGQSMGSPQKLRAIPYILEGIAQQDEMVWSSQVHELLQLGAVPSLRLSNNVAIYSVLTPKGREVHLEYKTRSFGQIKDGKVSLSKRDLSCPWIVHDLNLVGINHGNKNA